jgi:hypothetical protein
MNDQAIDEMDVIFNQHQMDITPETQEFFVKRGLIAVHYCGDILPSRDRCSSNPDDYKTRASRVLKRMHSYCQQGCLAVGYYNQHLPIRMIFGIIPAGSVIEPQLRDLWIDDDYPDGKTCYKTVQLKDFFEVDLTKNRQFESCLPRGNVFVKWGVNEIDHSVKYLFKLHHRLVSNKDRRVYDLSYSQLEVLCSEYLRQAGEDYKVRHFITPIGRSQKATDIDGVNESGNILAQVSFSTDDHVIKDKMKALLQYQHGTNRLLYFGPASKKDASLYPIQYISIERVFEEMKNTLLMKFL